MMKCRLADNSKARKHKRAMVGYTCILSAIDLSTGYKCGNPLKPQGHIEMSLEDFRLKIVSRNCITI